MNKMKRFSSTVRKIKKMSKRERIHQLYSNLWLRPAYYSLSSLLLFVVTVWIDFEMDVERMMFTTNYPLTQNILSTLTGGLLSLTAFTFYGVLTALTTFAGQFSPRILKNFMMNKVTQRTLGIFTGSFLYVLLSLFSIDEEAVSYYLFIPLTAIILAALSLGAFVVFINHIVTWLQVTHMTSDMKRESVEIIENSLENELNPYRVEDVEKIERQIPEGKGQQIKIDHSGYLQIVNFVPLVEQASKDDVIIKIEYSVGDFVFGSTPLLTYWSNKDASVKESDYKSKFQFGTSQKEIQDIGFSINKFVEIAIRALGNKDPKTTIATLYEIGDLLINISQKANFTPYLTDIHNKLRIILPNVNFENYLYIGFASIRHYARENVVVTVEILKILDAIAHGISARDYQMVWDFAEYIASGFEYEYMHNLDKRKYYKALLDIAETTGNKDSFEKLKQKYLDSGSKFSAD